MQEIFCYPYDLMPEVVPIEKGLGETRNVLLLDQHLRTVAIDLPLCLIVKTHPYKRPELRFSSFYKRQVYVCCTHTPGDTVIRVTTVIASCNTVDCSSLSQKE